MTETTPYVGAPPRTDHKVLVSMSDLPRGFDGAIGTDLECHDPGLKIKGPGWCYPKPDGHILGYGVWNPSFSCYLPVGHTEGNLDPVQVARWYDEVVVKSENAKIFANASYDMGWVRTVGITKWNGPIHDVLVQAPLINEHRFSYDLDALSEEKLPGAPNKDKSLLIDEAAGLGIKPKDIMANLRRMSPYAVGTYCVQDCYLTHELYYAQKPDVKIYSTERIYDLEMALIPMLIEMRARGVRVDVPQGEIVHEKLQRYLQKMYSHIHYQTGVRVDNCMDNNQLATLFASLDIKVPLTPKTKKPSVDKDWLETIKHPIARNVRRARQLHVTDRDYVHRDILNLSVDGRLYGQFNPLKSDEGGTISGRFSSSKPNLQQIPGRDKILAPLVRGLYLPEEGCMWAAMDYSSQEPRAITAMAFRSKIPSAAAYRQKYIEDPNTDFHAMAAEFTGLLRDDAKQLGLGIAYSMGGGKLALKLGLPTVYKTFTDRKTGQPVTYLAAGPEAQAIMDQFNDAAGFIRDLSKLCTKTAKSRGWLVTPAGRKFHYPYVNGEHFKAHKALNSLVQGMSADETKLAMLQMYREGYLPHVTVHDEIGIGTFTEHEQARRCVEIMLTVQLTPVPSKVDLDMGSSWGDSKKHPIELEGLPIAYSET